MTTEFEIRQVEKTRINEIDFDNIPFGRVFSDHMFIADYYDGEWQDPRIVPYESLALSPAISAIHYGQSIFEGMKAYRGPSGSPQLFRPLMNYRRFNRSAKRMCMPEINEELFIGGLRDLVDLDQAWIPKNESDSLYLRPFMFATDSFLGIKPSETYRFMIFTCPVGPYYAKPLNVKVSTEYVRAFPGGVGAAKAAGNYAASLYPTKLAQQAGFDQIIWLDGIDKRYIEESGTMNLFFVIDNVLITPVPEGTILEGVTRDSTIQLARDLGIPVEIRKLSIDEVVTAYNHGQLQEAFGAGTAATLAFIQSITYKDLQMSLNPNSPNSVRSRLRDQLEGIKISKVEDPHNWVYKV